MQNDQKAQKQMHKTVQKRTFMLIAIVLLALVILFIFYGQSFKATNIADGVLIDPGHGGADVGAIAPGSGVYEDKLNLEVSYALKNALSAKEIPAELTRNDPNALGDTKEADMQERARLIGKRTGGVMISIHMNSFPSDPKVWGPQVFYQKGSAAGKALANAIQFRLNQLTGGTRRIHEDDLYVLRAASVPAVLVECGFLTNETEDQKLQQPEYQNEIAVAIAAGILDYCR